MRPTSKKSFVDLMSIVGAPLCAVIYLESTQSALPSGADGIPSSDARRLVLLGAVAFTAFLIYRYRCLSSRIAYYGFGALFYISSIITAFSVMSYIGGSLNSFLTAPIGIKPDTDVGNFGSAYIFFLIVTAILWIAYRFATSVNKGLEKRSPAAPAPTASIITSPAPPPSPVFGNHVQTGEQRSPGKNPARVPENPKELKKRISKCVFEWLRQISDEPTERHREYFAFLRETGTPEDIDRINQGLLARVSSICDHAYLVHTGQCPTLPDTPDSQGSLTKELQNWAIASAGMKLTRCLDIRAAIEVNGPLDEMVHDRDYLIAIVRKNAFDDGLGGTLDVAEYEGHSGPEIAWMLIWQAGRDMFEAEMWAQVAHLAGDRNFLQRFEQVGSAATRSSLEHWLLYVNSGRVAHPNA